jgi:hypothetical protein
MCQASEPWAEQTEIVEVSAWREWNIVIGRGFLGCRLQ